MKNVVLAHKNFLKKQNAIYKNAFGTPPTEIVCDKRVKNGVFSYIIVWEYPEKLTSEIENFGKKISKNVSAISYPKEGLHTTIGNSPVAKNSEGNPQIISMLEESMKESISNIKPLHLKNLKWLYNSETVIIASTPDINFTQAFSIIKTATDKRGLTLKPPWGSHITVARFIKETNDLSALNILMKEAPKLENTTAIGINIGYGKINKDGFELQIKKRFSV